MGGIGGRGGTFDGADGDGEIELRRYAQVVWRRKLIIAVAVVLCAVLAYRNAKGEEPTYRAAAEVLLESSVSEQVFAPDQAGESTGRSQVQTEIAVMTSRSVQDAVADELGYTPRVNITQNGETDVVSIAASARSPEQAATDAQTYAEVYIEVNRDRLIDDLLAAATEVEAALAVVREQIATIEAPLTELDNEVLEATDFESRQAAQIRADAARQSAEAQLNALRTRESAYVTQLDSLQLATNINTTGGVQIVSDATEPAKPSSPRPRRDAGAGAALGLVLGVIAAFVREHFDDRLRSRDDLERATPGLPVLAQIPAPPLWRRRQPTLAFLVDPLSRTAEGYRALRTSIEVFHGARGSKILLVTSAEERDAAAASAVVANLAVALADIGRRVVAVDGNLRHARLHSLFGFVNDIGLSSVLSGELALTDAVREPRGPRALSILAAGPPRTKLPDLLASDETTAILQKLAEDADYVLVHCAPALSSNDSRALATHAAGVVLVVGANTSRGRTVARARAELEQVGAPMTGTVLSGAPSRAGRVPSQVFPMRDWIPGAGRPASGLPVISNGNASDTVSVAGVPTNGHGDQTEATGPVPTGESAGPDH